MKVVDSSGWLHYFMNGPLTERYASVLIGHQREITTPTIVIFEVYRRLKQVMAEDLAFSCISQMEKTHIVDLTTRIACRAARLSLEHKLATADSLVYSTADVYGLKLVTSDSDFRSLPNVEYISPEN